MSSKALFIMSTGENEKALTGLTVSFVGDIISGFVKDGYTPMVW